MLKRIITVAVLCFGFGFVTSAFAADAAKEIATALVHAQFSAGSKTVATVHLHLHHVVNCLVGANGEGFDASAGDPCHGMGNGAINDETVASTKANLDEVLTEAKRGLAQNDVGKARASAEQVVGMLKKLTGK